MKTEERDLLLLALIPSMTTLVLGGSAWQSAKDAILLGALQGFIFSGALVLLRYAAPGWKSCMGLKLLFVLYLTLSGGEALMGMWGFYREIYPKQISELGFLALSMMAAFLLVLGERGSLVNLSRAMGLLFLCSGAILVISGSPLFRWESLIAEPTELRRFTLEGFLPEFLVYCLMIEPEKNRKVWLLPVAFWGLTAATAVITELALGDSGKIHWPVYSVALLGKLSVFNRLEWVQILCWLLLLFLKLALYFWVGSELFPKMPLLFLGGAVGLTMIPMEQLSGGLLTGIREGLGWGIVGMIFVRGVCHWNGLQKYWQQQSLS